MRDIVPLSPVPVYPKGSPWRSACVKMVQRFRQWPRKLLVSFAVQPFKIRGNDPQVGGRKEKGESSVGGEFLFALFSI